MEGWVDLGSLIAARPGMEPTTAWSQVRQPNLYSTKPPTTITTTTTTITLCTTVQVCCTCCTTATVTARFQCTTRLEWTTRARRKFWRWSGQSTTTTTTPKTGPGQPATEVARRLLPSAAPRTPVTSWIGLGPSRAASSRCGRYGTTLARRSRCTSPGVECWSCRCGCRWYLDSLSFSTVSTWGEITVCQGVFGEGVSSSGWGSGLGRPRVSDGGEVWGAGVPLGLCLC